MTTPATPEEAKQILAVMDRAKTPGNRSTWWEEILGLIRERDKLRNKLSTARTALENIKTHAGNHSESMLSLSKCGQIARWGLGDENALHGEPPKTTSRPPDVPGSGSNPHPSVRNMVG